MVKNKILIVTGMHRSGTSLITQWLYKCGLHVGDEMVGALTGNDEGHFEDIDFLNAHEAILRGRRLPHNGFTNPVETLTADEYDRLHDIISYKSSLYPQWGWKEPRTCLFLDSYRQLLPGAFFFVVLRDPQAVVNSVIRRMYKNTEQKYANRKGLSKFIWEHYKKKRRMEKLFRKYSQAYLNVWIAYNEAILRHLQQIPERNYLVADYTFLLQKSQEVFEHLSRQWGFTLSFTDFKEVYKGGLLQSGIDIRRYIKDKTLLPRSAAVEASLKKLSVFNTRQRTLLAV